MKTKVLTIDQWNEIKKDKDTNTKAVKGDRCVLINGVAFLIQRKNNFNNVICIRIEPSKEPITKTFEAFCKWCESKKLQYIRVEGVGKHTYRMLYRISRTMKQTDVVKHVAESLEYHRHIYYVKTY